MAQVERLDANLLVTLHAVIEERNITRAAETLRTTPAAVSHALARIRTLLEDPIIIRAGRTFELSGLAQRIRPIVGAAVAESERTWNLRRDFDPATSDRRFLISASDYAMTVLAEPLFELFEVEAPGVSIAFEALPVIATGIDSVLLRRDIAIASHDRGISGKTADLFEDDLVVVGRRGHPAARDGAFSELALQTERFAVSSIGPTSGLVGQMFERSGIVPQVAVSVGGFSPLPWLIATNDLLSIIPRRVLTRYAASLSLQEFRSPLTPERIIETAYFNPAFSEDAGVKWLLDALQRVPPALE